MTARSPYALLPALVVAVLLPLRAAAQDKPAASSAALRVTVRDPSGAVIPGAVVRVARTDAAGGQPGEATSDQIGVAVVQNLEPGRYSLEVSFPGFETQTIPGVRLRRGETRREVTLPLPKVDESVSVGRDPATSASDPNGERLGNVLTRDQIDALPDDPDEMQKTLEAMGGPGTTIRVDGFRGGRLPPKSQIRSIRFSTNMLAAENHDAGHAFVDIQTQPGIGALRGSVDFGFRDDALDARNAFLPVKAPERTQQYTLNLSGTLVKNRTSFSLSAGGASLYDSANVFAAVPEGGRATPVRRPADRLDFTGRVDHALTRTHTLRASVQRDANDQQNLGVGSYDLADRAYSRRSTDTLVRLSESGPWSRNWFGEWRVQVHQTSFDVGSAVEAPTTRVLDAFTSGGAQQSGGSRATEVEWATNVDYAKGHHAVRLGSLVEGGSYRGDVRTNYLGTYTFASLADYEAGRPATYTRRSGDPLVLYSMWQGGIYAQDDWRVRKDLTLSGGLRQELQTHAGAAVNLAPRGGFTWSPFKNGKTTVRGGGGLFYDWLDASTYEQTLRVDGVRQQDTVIRNPGYPDPFDGSSAAQILPPSRYLLSPGLPLPRRSLETIAVSQQFTPTTRLNVSYNHGAWVNRLRGRNVNAPDATGMRPDASLGNITEVEPTSRMRSDSVVATVSITAPQKHLLLFGNYAWVNQRNDADGPFSLPANNYDLAAEWGPAAGVPRHQASVLLSTGIGKNIRVGFTASGHSGVPYTITTGHDDNGDTVFTDRPAGVGRNTARTKGAWDSAVRVSYAFGFGQRGQNAAGGGPQVFVMRTGDAGGMLGALGGGGADDKRIRVELYAAVQNIFNTVNPIGYSGVTTSPFFGQPTAAGPARKIDLGVKIGF